MEHMMEPVVVVVMEEEAAMVETPTNPLLNFVILHEIIVKLLSSLPSKSFVSLKYGFGC